MGVKSTKNALKEIDKVNPEVFFSRCGRARRDWTCQNSNFPIYAVADSKSVGLLKLSVAPCVRLFQRLTHISWLSPARTFCR